MKIKIAFIPSETFNNMRTNYLRRPHGFKKAAVNNARKAAVPPTAWDDIPNKGYINAWDYAIRFFNPNMEFTFFCKKFLKKFPRWKTHEIKEIFYDLKDFLHRQKFHAKQ